jgi:hypothetical protein
VQRLDAQLRRPEARKPVGAEHLQVRVLRLLDEARRQRLHAGASGLRGLDRVALGQDLVELLGREQRLPEREAELSKLSLLARRHDRGDDDAVVRVRDLMIEVEACLDETVELRAVVHDHLHDARPLSGLAPLCGDAACGEEAHRQHGRQHERTGPVLPPHLVLLAQPG